jgi:carbon-monoxide dehydrogenase small subunit
MLITLNINGRDVARDVEARTTLADFLRDACDLTATHLGCEHGVCGACTVSVDGQAVRACLLFAAMCEGASVHTLEGLNEDRTIKVLQKHFHESHALQCGFCTPAMLIIARDILRRKPTLDAETIRHELSGHMCRCTGFAGIVAAIEGAWRELSGVGAPVEEVTSS